MSTATEQEILNCEEQLADAKRGLDLKALDRIYADDIGDWSSRRPDLRQDRVHGGDEARHRRA